MPGIEVYFPPVTSENVCRYYFPVFGAANYTAFAYHVLNPGMLAEFTKYDVAAANAMFFNAHIGVGLYIYYRQHMRKVSGSSRLLYSVYGAVVFNFGSVLLFASTNMILPRNTFIRLLFGTLTSFMLLRIGKEYLSYVDTFSPDE